jgi:hypothetical protein
MKSSHVITGVAVAAALGAVAFTATANLRNPDPALAAEVTVYKSPTCGCCSKWVEHLRANGFTVTAVDVADMGEVKANLGISAPLVACHTAVVDGYVIEGHVPAQAIQRLLNERPQVAGLAVPGMPMGSPGMEGPNPQHYDVLTFDSAGQTTVFESY